MAVLLTFVKVLCLIFACDKNTVNAFVDEFADNYVPNDNYKVIILKENQHVNENFNDMIQLKIYCYNNSHKSLLFIWRSIHLELEHVPLNYKLYSGENESEVYKKYETESIWNPVTWFTGRSTIIDFPAFSSYCVGISTKENYVLYFKVKIVNYWRLLLTIIGILLFLSAPSLSRNSFFHYTSGVTLGMVASVLILIYILSHYIPKRSASYAILIFGYSFIFYFLQVLWHNLNQILSNHTDVFLSYCFLSAFISFVVCYRLGPVKNVRTCNIIQWAMQMIGLVLIFFSSEYRELSTALIIIILGSYLIPRKWIAKFKAIWYYYFPPKIKLLTELEYIEQGTRETKKALENLKHYCNSPDCNAWKIISRLKDPIRFANFIQTGNHFTDDELLEYNSEEFFDRLTDEEDDGQSDSNTFHNFCR